MKLMDLTVKEYLNKVKSDSPAPGGGSVSAMSGAQSAALIIMVCDLTIGREKYANYEEFCIESKAKTIEIFEELTILVDKDTDAYNLVAQAFKLPKETESEKEIRKAEIAKATLFATETPFRTMELCMEAIAIAESLIGKTNTNAASDLGVAGLNLYAALKGAWMNVRINLSGIKDSEKVGFFNMKGSEMENKALKIVENIENKTMELL